MGTSVTRTHLRRFGASASGRVEIEIDARVLHHARVDRARSRVLDGAARAVVAARATSRTRRGRDATAALARARAVAI